MEISDFEFIARTNAVKYVKYHPLYIELDDVVQELVIDMWEKYEAGKFTTEKEAWVICRNKLFDIFRDWGTKKRGEGEYTMSLDAVVDDENDSYDSIQRLPDESVYEDTYDLEQTFSGDVNVDITVDDVRQAARDYKVELRALRERGYVSPLPLLMENWSITIPFLARLTVALVGFGATPDMARKIVALGLRIICNGYEATDEDDYLIKHYRARAGSNIKWFCLPQGDIELRRGNTTAFVQRS